MTRDSNLLTREFRDQTRRRLTEAGRCDRPWSCVSWFWLRWRRPGRAARRSRLHRPGFGVRRRHAREPGSGGVVGDPAPGADGGRATGRVIRGHNSGPDATSRCSIFPAEYATPNSIAPVRMRLSNPNGIAARYLRRSLCHQARVCPTAKPISCSNAARSSRTTSANLPLSTKSGTLRAN